MSRRKSKLPPETPAQRAERIRKQDEAWKKQNDHYLAHKREEEAREQRKREREAAELAADKRPRWMREHVIDPAWMKANVPAPCYRATQSWADAIMVAVESRLKHTLEDKAVVDGTLAILADAGTAGLRDGTDGRYEIADAVASFIDGLELDKEDKDTIAKVRAALPVFLGRLRNGVETGISFMLDLHQGGTVSDRAKASDECAQLQADIAADETGTLYEAMGIDAESEIMRLSLIDRQDLCRHLNIPLNTMDHIIP